MTYSVICDWLDVTTHPDSGLSDSVLGFVSGIGVDFIGSDNSLSVRFPEGGVLRVDKKSSYSRISASGSVLAYLRMQNKFNDYLDLLGSVPHKVTRLDAAYDTDEDGAKVFSRLKRKYREKPVMLTRQGLKANFVSEFREVDGKETGSFYAGHRTKSGVTGCVYDKALEILQRTGATDGLPRSRYELRVRSSIGPTLRDAAEPDKLFWHFMSPALIRKPKGFKIDSWVSGWGGGWTSDKPSPPDPAGSIRYLLEASLVFERLEVLADDLGPNGRQYLRRQLNKRFSDLS